MVIVGLLFIYGLIIGSFLNALVWRISKRRDWVRERSECTHCKHKLSALDLVPVVSWLFLRGKCRYCHKRIDDSPLTELGLGIAFAVSVYAWPYMLATAPQIGLFIIWLFILTAFAVLCLYDFKSFLLPDKFTYPLIPLSILFVIYRSVINANFSILSALAGGLLCFSLFWLLYQVSKGGWIGGGDVKLIASAGLLAGSISASLGVIFLSSLLGTLYAVPLIIHHKRVKNIKVPYGPFIIIATVLVVLYYPALNEWVTTKLFVI